MKTQVAIRLLCISFLFIASSSCKKYSKELTTINFHVYNPISGEGLSGVKVQVIQQEDVTGSFQVESEYESTVIWEGYTDVNGKASYSFNAMKKDKFTYWQSADINYIQENNRKLLKQPDFQEEGKHSVNNNEYKYTVPASFVWHIKNVNCFDETDRFRSRRSWVYHTQYTDESGWTNWSQNQFGCYELVSDYNYYSDIVITEYEVERNGILNTYLDTFYINPNYVDTLKIYY